MKDNVRNEQAEQAASPTNTEPEASTNAHLANILRATHLGLLDGLIYDILYVATAPISLYEQEPALRQFILWVLTGLLIGSQGGFALSELANERSGIDAAIELCYWQLRLMPPVLAFVAAGVLVAHVMVVLGRIMGI